MFYGLFDYGLCWFDIRFVDDLHFSNPFTLYSIHLPLRLMMIMTVVKSSVWYSVIIFNYFLCQTCNWLSRDYSFWTNNLMNFEILAFRRFDVSWLNYKYCSQSGIVVYFSKVASTRIYRLQTPRWAYGVNPSTIADYLLDRSI